MLAFIFTATCLKKHNFDSSLIVLRAKCVTVARGANTPLRNSEGSDGFQAGFLFTQRTLYR